MLNNKTILITGGTGNFGHHFVSFILKNYHPKKIIIFSRDEYKQFHMQNTFKEFESLMRFFIGDVRDKDRLFRALNGVDYVVHAAEMKQITTCEYNPIEAIKTNINGACNVIDACIDAGVKKVIALSTDKSVSPANLYGSTKMVSDKLFVAANAYSGIGGTRFSVVRYGSVAGSRGSVIPYFQSIIDNGGTELPITDYRMTRFWASHNEGVKLIIRAFEDSCGGEIFISKAPSFKITDLAHAMLPGCGMPEIGIREGEKIHEIMISAVDSDYTYEYDDHYIVYPNFKWWNQNKLIPGGKKVDSGFVYSSNNNREWMSVVDIRSKLKIDLDYFESKA